MKRSRESKVRTGGRCMKEEIRLGSSRRNWDATRTQSNIQWNWDHKRQSQEEQSGPRMDVILL